ncbi:MAG: NUDIX domain-containing protein [Proteobacteria bacterium]|nr:NUDIX domain-containing protein [Pseudomonadota bacterium]
MPEYIDIFDANMSPVPPYKMERKEVVKTMHWHHTFDCWIVRRDPSGDKILLQLRSKQKINNPNTLDISAAGWLQSGERHEVDGIREVEEELGITVDPTDLYYVGMVKEATDRPGYYARNFCHTYFYETTHRLSNYKPQASEVDGLFEINISEGIKLFSGEQQSIEITGVAKDGQTYQPTQRTISTSDMCGEHDRCKLTKYYLKIFLLAELYLRGHRPLVI